jgi:uroporphyrinogen decarboxylase
MTSRERVNKAMAQQDTDRVPINFRATEQVAQRLAAALETDYNGILQHFRVDFREVVPAYIGPRHAPVDGCAIDIWGVGRREVVSEHARDVLITLHPLAGAESVEAVAAHHWPRAEWFDFSRVAQMCRDYDAYAISTPGMQMSGYHGVFHLLTYLFGMERAMMDLAAEPELMEEAIRRIMDFYTAYYTRLFEAAAGRIDFLFYKDDFGAQNSLLISPRMFRTFFYPCIVELARLAARHGARLALHSCGSVRRLIPDFIEAGVAVLDPIQVTAADMDIRDLKSAFGDRLVFHGAIDVQRLMPFGTPAEIRASARATIDVLGQGGGYFFSPSHRFQPDTPVENILALYAEALGG